MNARSRLELSLPPHAHEATTMCEKIINRSKFAVWQSISPAVKVRYVTVLYDMVFYRTNAAKYRYTRTLAVYLRLNNIVVLLARGVTESCTEVKWDYA